MQFLDNYEENRGRRRIKPALGTCKCGESATIYIYEKLMCLKCFATAIKEVPDVKQANSPPS